MSGVCCSYWLPQVGIIVDFDGIGINERREIVLADKWRN